MDFGLDSSYTLNFLLGGGKQVPTLEAQQTPGGLPRRQSRALQERGAEVQGRVQRGIPPATARGFEDEAPEVSSAFAVRHCQSRHSCHLECGGRLPRELFGTECIWTQLKTLLWCC